MGDQLSANTCAVHEIIMQTIDDKIEDLRQGQKDMQSLLREQHTEIVDSLLKVAQLHREDIRTFMNQIQEDLDTVKSDWEKRFNALSEDFRSLKSRVMFLIAASVGAGGALGWFVSNYENLSRVLGVQ